MTRKQPLDPHVGEWVQVRFSPTKPTKNGIIAFIGLRGSYEAENPGEIVGVFLPKEGRVRQYRRDQLVLLRDKPRAWTRNGTPPAGKWIYTHDEETGGLPGTVSSSTPSTKSDRRFWVGEEEEYDHDPC